MKLHELARDRLAEAKPAVLARRRPVRLPERIENMREEASVDSLTGVDDLDAEAGVPCEANGGRALSSGELDRIRNQVPHDLLQPVGIARRRDRGTNLNLGRQRNVFRSGSGTHALYCRVDNLREIHRLNLDAQLSRDDARGWSARSHQGGSIVIDLGLSNQAVFLH